MFCFDIIGFLLFGIISILYMKALNRTGNRKTINVNPGLSRNRFVPKPVYPKTGLQNGSETGLENGSISGANPLGGANPSPMVALTSRPGGANSPPGGANPPP